MILLAHARDGRDVFITKDVTAFVRHGRREQLEALCSTRIMTPDEFVEWIALVRSTSEVDVAAGGERAARPRP